MADRSTSQSSDQETQETQEYQSGSRPQASFDSSFFEQMSGQSGSPSAVGWDFIRPIVDGYHDNAEATLRQARRVTEQYAQYLILQQTTSEIARVVAPQVAQQVIAHLKQNPELLRS